MTKPVTVIIPTFGRPSSVVMNTLNSIFQDSKNLNLVQEVIVIDQNTPKLDLQSVHPSVIHVHGLSPSVTAAKNHGISLATGEYLVFFDDDVTVHPGTIANFHSLLLTHPKAGFFAGREIIDSALVIDSGIKKILRKAANLFLPRNQVEKQYQIGGHYVGRIFSSSIMISDYSLESPELVQIDGARGCIWAAKTETVKQAGCFDVQFKGTALREETDLYLRIKKLYPNCYYTSQSVVTHHRQLGGCDNLAINFSRLVSKFENELYFQKKHFANVSAFYFFVRLAPLALSTVKETRGASLLYWLAFSCKAIF